VNTLDEEMAALESRICLVRGQPEGEGIRNPLNGRPERDFRKIVKCYVVRKTKLSKT
jgi:hypothetical protein